MIEFQLVIPCNNSNLKNLVKKILVILYIKRSLEYIFEDREVDERFLHKFEIIAILRGDLDPLTQYIDEIAYKNLDYKLVDHPDLATAKILKT